MRLAVAVCPRASWTEYGIVAVPVKLAAGVKVTFPAVVLTLHWLPFESVKAVCWPLVDGSKSIVLITMLFPGPNAVSFAVILGRVTGVLKGVAPLSS
jgi:hypothetical protein